MLARSFVQNKNHLEISARLVTMLFLWPNKGEECQTAKQRAKQRHLEGSGLFAKDPTVLSKTPTSLWSCALYHASGLTGVSHRSRASCKTRISSWASPLGDAALWAWRASRNRCSRALGMSPTRPREGWNSNSEAGLEEEKKG